MNRVQKETSPSPPTLSPLPAAEFRIQASTSSSHPRPTARSSPDNTTRHWELPPKELTYLEDLKQFAKVFKDRRILLGFSQNDVASAMSKLYGNDISQNTISNFETVSLSFKIYCRLKPLFQKWLEDADKTMTDSKTLSNSFTTSHIIGPWQSKPRMQAEAKSAHEVAFNQNPKPTAEEIKSLADDLAMSTTKVRGWFNNRRHQEKRRNLPSSRLVTPPSLSLHSEIFNSNALSPPSSSSLTDMETPLSPHIPKYSSLPLISHSCGPLPSPSKSTHSKPDLHSTPPGAEPLPGTTRAMVFPGKLSDCSVTSGRDHIGKMPRIERQGE